MLDNLDEFIEATTPIMRKIMGWDSYSISTHLETEGGDLYCPKCQGPRRVKIIGLRAHGLALHLWGIKKSMLAVGPGGQKAVQEKPISDIEPSLFHLECLQCKSRFTVVIYSGLNSGNMAVFPNTTGGLATKNTPKNVRYFLDEAYKAQAGGAVTGAVLLYRAALEQLLTEQSYKKQNITDKIKELEENVKSGTGPKWVHDIDSAYLRVIKDLANEGIHVNSGDTDTLKSFDSNLLADIQLIFVDLLDLVYEKPIRKAEKLKQLQSIQKEANP